ncbi:VanZ family protein, partial [Listeria innocua]|nr:VanZ family protein [Listeria innocua]
LVAYISIGDFVNSTYTGNFHIQKEMINLIPFTTIENTFQQTLPTMPTIIQIIGNVLLLCPLSFFLLYFKITSAAGKTILVIFLTSCGIELLQFAQTTMITGFESISLPPNRSTDVDDIILNTLSGLIGVLLAYAIPPVRKRINKRR